ncbi:MAG: hypothetical protein V7603_2583 [Micromonosporaceae bacterium]
MPAALADQLTAARRRAFVGRRAELRLFESLLADPGTGGGVVYLRGPGGVGKTTLLRQLAWLGRDAGRRVLWLDGREAAAGGGLLACLTTALDVPGPDAALAALAGATGLLLLVDSVDEVGPPPEWLPEELLAALPGGALAVLAGREPPPLHWRVDPGWRGLVRTHPLGNLGPDESARLLETLGVPGAEHPAALAFTRGHPLALAIVADVYAQRGGGLALPASPEVVAALLAGLLDAVPSGAHRAALEAGAQVRVTTEPLLAALLGVPDARELFDWLRGLSVMESGPRGLYPHDLVRDALGAELRWRHPDRYAELHRRAGTYYQQQFTGAEPAAQQAVLSDFAYLHRDSEVLGPFLSGLSPTAAGAGNLAVTPGREDDWPAVRELVRRHEGAAAAGILEYWLGRLPECLAVARTGSGPVAGCCLVLPLHAVSTVDTAADPAVDRALAYLRRRAPLRDQERAYLVRFWLSADEYQDTSPVATLIALHLVRQYLTTPDLAVSLWAYADPQFWAPMCQYADFTRVPEADFEVDARRYGVYAHDWRVVPPLRWLGLLGARETAEQPLAVPGGGAGQPPPRVLDADEFARAVRAALHDVGRADRLRTSPLVRSRLVAGRLGGDGPPQPGQAVQEVLREAAAQLEAAPQDRRGYRALHHTYLQPAGSQQRAAELLDLPMSTFRRHLAAGVERLTEILWERELAGD